MLYAVRLSCSGSSYIAPMNIYISRWWRSRRECPNNIYPVGSDLDLCRVQELGLVTEYVHPWTLVIFDGQCLLSLRHHSFLSPRITTVVLFAREPGLIGRKSSIRGEKARQIVTVAHLANDRLHFQPLNTAKADVEK